MKNKIFKSNKNKGFTLIETLVSIALFSVVVVMAGATIVSIININKKNQAISSVVNNLNYSIDSMVRDIKTGYLYKCDYSETFTVVGLKASTNISAGTCSDGLTLVSTISGIDTVVTYKWNKPTGGNDYIEKTVYTTDTNNTSYSITDKNNVNIESLKFNVKSPDALDCDRGDSCVYGQPSVAVVVKGTAGNQLIDVSNFYIQTYISQRLLNVTDFKDSI